MKKLILSFVFIFAITVSLFLVSASAFEIVTTDIDIVLDKSGDAFVTEKWTVAYTDAENLFNRHFDIYSAENTLSLVQKYGEITDVKVKVDGKELAQADGKNAYTFRTDEVGGDLCYVVAVNYPSANVSRTYEISYTLTDAVKKNGRNAVFAYMVIGEKFDYTSNNVTVNVIFPDGVKASDISINDDYEGEIKDNKAVFFSGRVGNTFSVSAFCDGDFFNADSLEKYSESAQKITLLINGLKKALPFIIAILGVLFVVLFVLYPDRTVRFSLEKKVRKELKADPEKEFIVPENKTACECYKILHPSSRIKPVSTSKRVSALFAMAILECVEYGYIIEEDGKLIVGTPRNDVPAYIASVLNFLKSFSTQKGNRYIIDKDFAERVVAECETRYDLITNYLSTFYSLVEGESLSFFMKKGNKEIYKSVYALEKGVGEVKHKPSFTECMESVLTGGKTKDADIFAMMYASSPDKIFAKGSGIKGEKELCEAISAMYKVFIKSK